LKAYVHPTYPLTGSHVILTTYDVITGGDFSIFRNIPRWEMLVVDEGQRRKLSHSGLDKADDVVKSDSNLIFNRLKTLNTVHRILLTGTPLNNNLRELFNLLNFLDPVNFKYVCLFLPISFTTFSSYTFFLYYPPILSSHTILPRSLSVHPPCFLHLRFRNLADLEERFSDLNETLLGELHDMIQPYILRRIKADVLRLPPKVSYLIMIIV
jgi:SNF2 family DNA or RNA helicase